jgi:hypothetical protein
MLADGLDLIQGEAIDLICWPITVSTVEVAIVG